MTISGLAAIDVVELQGLEATLGVDDPLGVRTAELDDGLELGPLVPARRTISANEFRSAAG
jgi:hypothetical protein